MADAAFGVVLKKGTSAIDGTFNDFGLEITSITPPSTTRTAIDASHHGEDYGLVIMSGLKRQNPFSVEVNWDQSASSTIKTELESTTMVYWKIEFGDGASSVIFKAGISAFTPGALDPDGKATATIEFTPSGEPTWA